MDRWTCSALTPTLLLTRFPLRARLQLLVIRSPLRGVDDAGDDDDNVAMPFVELDVRWWGESCLMVGIFAVVLLRLPDAPIADRLAVIGCLLGGIAFSFIAVVSQHLHFCRVGIDTGLAIGGSLVPLVLLVQASTHPDNPQWRYYLWLSVAMTASMCAWLAVVKFGAYCNQQVPDPNPHDSVAGVASYVFLWAHCTLLLGAPCPPLVAGCYGVAMFGLITRGLASTVPQSFTLGEATIIVQATVILLQELCAHVVGGDRVVAATDQPAKFTACTLAGAAVLILTWLPAALWASRRGRPTPHARKDRAGSMSQQGGNAVEAAVRPWSFISAFAIGVVVITLPLTSAVLQEDSVQWLFTYVVTSWAHIGALGYWGACLAIFLPGINVISSSFLIYKEQDAGDGAPGASHTANDEMRHTSRQQRLRLGFRKLFHVLALLLFVPVLLGDPEFLGLSCGIALFVLVALECFRVAEVPLIGPMLDALMERYRDEKDPGELLTTHIYLLVACAVPLWLSGSAVSPLVSGIGLVAVGVGDAVAAVVGCNYGTHRIFRTSKTIEGALASSLAQIGAIASVYCFVTESPPFQVLVVAAAAGALYEAVTLQSDNLVVPLIVWVLVASDLPRS